MLMLIMDAGEPLAVKHESFFSFGGFLGNVTASVLAGGIVLWLGYLFIQRRLRLKDNADRRAEDDQQRTTNRQAVLSIVHRELESNAAARTIAVQNLAHEDQRIVYPLFDLKAWPLVTAGPIFTTLARETAVALISIYNRLATANELHALLIDLHQGQTSITVAIAAAQSIDTNQRVKEVYDQFLDHRRYLRSGLIERLEELKQHLDTAIDAIEGELGRRPEKTAAERHYVPDVAAEWVGGSEP
jgi:hypothetical protein